MTATTERVTAPSDEVRRLVDELNQALAGPYEPDQHHGLSLDELFTPEIRFFVARLDGTAVGCGGVALFDGYAELKRMYVREAARGRGVADLILERVEAEVREAESGPLRLETGSYQHGAIRFYEKKGFSACGPFGAYLAMPAKAIALSLFFEKAV